MGRISERDLSRVCKRLSCNYPSTLAVRCNLVIFLSVEILKSGPTLRKATEVVTINRYLLNYQDLIATVDGLDFTSQVYKVMDKR